MQRFKIILCALLIFPFIHLTMCPAAEKIGKGYVDHVVIMKIRTALEKKHSPDYQCFTPCVFLHAADSPRYCGGRICGPAPRMPSAQPAAILCALSATRLLL